MPIGAVTGRAELLDAPHPGGMGGTYSGNPLACVAALATIGIVSAPSFLERATEVGERLRAGLVELSVETSAHRRRTRPRTDAGDRAGQRPALTPDPDITLDVTKATLSRGLITIRAGLYSNCVRFLPPLTVTDEQIDEALAVLSDSFDEVAASRSAA